MMHCPFCGLPPCPVCRRCPAAGHLITCESEEARRKLAEWYAREWGAQEEERAVGEERSSFFQELAQRVRA